MPLQCPDIGRFLNVSLPSGLLDKYKDEVDNATQTHSPSTGAENFALAIETQDFLPKEIEELPHAGRDVLRRLLEVDPKKRIRSVMALQRIAMYKDFKIEAEHLLSITPLDIILKDGISMRSKEKADEALNAAATKAFQDF